jgi:hypothetical protein
MRFDSQEISCKEVHYYATNRLPEIRAGIHTVYSLDGTISLVRNLPLAWATRVIAHTLPVTTRMLVLLAMALTTKPDGQWSSPKSLVLAQPALNAKFYWMMPI